MTFGARPFGSRTFGDSAPLGAGVMPTAGGGGASITPASVVVEVVAGVAAFNFDLDANDAAVAVAVTAPQSVAVGTVAPGGPAAGAPGYPSEVIHLPFQYTTRSRDHARLSQQDLEQRDRELEDYLGDQLPEMVWSYPGRLVASSSSPRRVRRYNTLLNFIFELTEAGTTDTRLQLLVNGSPVLVAVIPATETELLTVNRIKVVPNQDLVAWQIVTAGTGATGLTVQCEARQAWRQYARNFN